MSLFAYVGCRTTEERNARGRGISVYRIDGQSSQWSLLQLLETEPNPSFLALHPMLDILYSVHGDLDLVTSYSIDLKPVFCGISTANVLAAGTRFTLRSIQRTDGLSLRTIAPTASSACQSHPPAFSDL